MLVVNDSTLSFTWTGLNEGSYNFSVVASTAVGPGEAANLTQSIRGSQLIIMPIS